MKAWGRHAASRKKAFQPLELGAMERFFGLAFRGVIAFNYSPFTMPPSTSKACPVT